MIRWLQARSNKVQLISFLLMLIPPVPMYFAVQSGQYGLLILMMVLFTLGNILILLVR